MLLNVKIVVFRINIPIKYGQLFQLNATITLDKNIEVTQKNFIFNQTSKLHYYTIYTVY